MNDIDKWYAEQCGVVIADYGKEWSWKLGDDYFYFMFTIEDPRCREVCRGWWLKSHKASSVTFFNPDEFENESVEFEWIDEFDDSMCLIKGDEEACLTAIYEARDE